MIDHTYFICQILNVGEQHGASGSKSLLRSKVEAERYVNPFTSDAPRLHECIGMSTTVDELYHRPSLEKKTRDAEQVVADGKSWKALRGKGETVWPPLL
jgi:hypothetical protein